MNPNELKRHVQTSTDSHFFDRATMQFFGDTMSNYGVRRTTIAVNDSEGGTINLDCWELYRKKPVKYGIQSSAYFGAKTFSRVFPAS